MTGRTNASAAGGAEMELIWTNANPSQAMNNFTLPIEKCFGVVVHAKRTIVDVNTAWASNFCQNGHTERVMGFTSASNAFNSQRSVTVTDSYLTITLDSGADNRNTLPLRIYLIV